MTSIFWFVGVFLKFLPNLKNSRARLVVGIEGGERSALLSVHISGPESKLCRMTKTLPFVPRKVYGPGICDQGHMMSL